ncbi:hypothetical protein AX16_003354 [Volvariella volvacea WC 439]|nr:hypothetical protein AX16_003354 [Volvariella volvacea WC 439]
MGYHSGDHDTEAVNGNPAPTNLMERAHIQNNGGIFVTSVGNGNHTTIPFSSDVSFQVKKPLVDLVVANAMHTGKVRAEPLRCDPNTRRAVILDIISWVENRCQQCGVLWLLGPAGIGESAIAMTVAMELDQKKDSKAKIAGSFFFIVSDPQRNNFRCFIPTIVYQLAKCLKEVERAIDRVLGEDPKILEAELEVQWRKLVIETVKAVPNIPPALIVIDGLDECGSPNDQRRILNLVSSCGPGFPLAFLIASRHELHLMNTFMSRPLILLCRLPIDLTWCKDDREMRRFVRSSFSAIYFKHRDILRSCAEDGVWPSDDVVDFITLKADGQYIYPVTLFRYIDTDDADPHEQLKACLAQTPEALSSIDCLYTQILRLSHKPNDERVQDTLFLVTTFRAGDRPMPEFFKPPPKTAHYSDMLYERKPEDIPTQHHQLFYLFDSWPSCFIRIPRIEDLVPEVHHKSFSDFLQDPERSGPYHINVEASATRVVIQCLTKLDEVEDSQLAHLVDLWWRCSKYLANSEIDEKLVKLLEDLDFSRCLERLMLQGVLEALWIDYNNFSAICSTWYVPSSFFVIAILQLSVVQRNQNIPTLTDKFPNDVLNIAIFAWWLRRYMFFLAPLGDDVVKYVLLPDSYGLSALLERIHGHLLFSHQTHLRKSDHEAWGFLEIAVVVAIRDR